MEEQYMKPECMQPGGMGPEGMRPDGGGCCQRHGPEGERDKFHMMMCMAKEAKMELLQEKIKKKIEATQGKKLDEIAAVIADLMAEKQKSRMGMKKKKMEAKKKLEDILMEE